MSQSRTRLTTLLMTAAVVAVACSFDPDELRARPARDAEWAMDQVIASTTTKDSVVDSTVTTDPVDALSTSWDVPPRGTPDTPPLELEAGLSIDVAISGGAGGAPGGAGGSGGPEAPDGLLAVRPDGVDGAGPASNGGTSGAGGMTGGGLAGNGGTPGSGGLAGNGGTPGSGGLASSGGKPGSGGTIAAGGRVSAGGTTTPGGTGGSGGTPAGAYCATYTDLGTLPSTSTEYTAVPAAATCFRFAVAAPNEVMRGIQMANCGTRTLTINGADPGCSPSSDCVATTVIARSADGYWYVQFSASTATACSTTWWWSP